jgi:gliding motility-associated-like protein
VLVAGDELKIKLFVKAAEQGNTINIASVSSETEDSDITDNEDSDELMITKLFIPTVFTPNGDGDNDTFVIKGTEDFERLEIEIANRWGDQVYKSSNYQNDWSAIGLPEGTYFYIIKAFSESGEKDYKGWVQIMREINN